MECSQKPAWSKFVKERKLKIQRPDEEIFKHVLKNWDKIAKPLDGMGRFETLTAQIGAISGTDKMDLSKKAVVIMCADNGIVEEGVSQSGQEVTAAVAQNMAHKQSCVGRMAAAIGADTIPVDIGISRQKPIHGVLNRKVRQGTRNFLKEPAMTKEETLRAIGVGIDMVQFCKASGYQLIGTGEMGIGNTTTSSAIAAALLKCDVAKVTGRGAGLSDKGLLQKQQVINAAIEKYDLYHEDVLTVLQTVGGLDIAGLVGVCIGGAVYHVPVVLDGVISMVAALVAQRLIPGTADYLIPSHKGKEPAMELLAKELGLEPVIDGRLALGEGTGAVMMFGLLDMAMQIYRESNTFADIEIEQYTRNL